MSLPRVPAHVAEALSRLGLRFEPAPSEIALPSGIVFAVQAFGPADDEAAITAASNLVAQANGLAKWCRAYGFAFDLRVVAELSTDAEWLEGMFQHARAVEFAKRIVTEIRHDGTAVPPTPALLAAILADRADRTAFLTAAIPPRLVNARMRDRAIALARYLWGGGGGHCDGCALAKAACATTGDGCPKAENKPRTPLEAAANAIVLSGGLWIREPGRAGLDWAGARAAAPASVAWEDLRVLLADLEAAFRDHLSNLRDGAEGSDA